ncbi:MAG: hypothetical protein DMD61_02915 [Gemmatimonadetes bacterium]|nr:MAG: hypothetical protein DMD61_02915 [Gemmatimonadota bacterium]
MAGAPADRRAHAVPDGARRGAQVHHRCPRWHHRPGVHRAVLPEGVSPRPRRGDVSPAALPH